MPPFISSSPGMHRRLRATVLGSGETLKLEAGKCHDHFTFWEDYSGWMSWKGVKRQDWRLLQSSRQVIKNASVKGESLEIQRGTYIQGKFRS